MSLQGVGYSKGAFTRSEIKLKTHILRFKLEPTFV